MTHSVYLIACGFFLFALIGYAVGRWTGESDRQKLQDKLQHVNNVLGRAGLSTDDIKPPEQDGHSWTGQRIPESVKAPPGTIRRWDETGRTGAPR